MKLFENVKAFATASRARRILFAAIAIFLELAILTAIVGVILSACVRAQGAKNIITDAQAQLLIGVDCILVLGAGVRSDGTPSDMLRDRLAVGVALYKAGVAPKLLMSGDHMHEGYDEVGAMRRYAIEQGVPAEDIFTDHAGISTYDSLYRAKNVFCVDNIVVITQEYHLPRALYTAQQLNIKAYGVSASLNTYSGQSARDVREVFARVKDFAYSYLELPSTFGGEKIPITENADGNVTNG